MCTAVRFTDENGGLFFGRNLDWTESYGEKILATPRGFAYDYALGATQSKQRYAVVGVGCIMDSKPMYFDCANETGLAVAGLNFPRCGAFPHESVEGKCSVATFEFPLWVARNFASTDEVEHARRRRADRCFARTAGTARIAAALAHRRQHAQHRSRKHQGRSSHLREPRRCAGKLARATVAHRQSGQLSAHKQRKPATKQLGCARTARMGHRSRHARHTGRPLLAFAFRARDLCQRPPSRQNDRARKRSTSFPNPRIRASNGRHSEIGRGTFRENHFHQRILQFNEHLLREYLDDFEIRAFPFESFKNLDGRELQTRALHRGEEEGR